MGVAEQASMALITSIIALLTMIPLGVQEATCGVIGNCIGANKVNLARRFFSLILKINSFVVFTISVILIVARDQIIGFFTKDAAVMAIVHQVLALLSIVFIFEGT